MAGLKKLSLEYAISSVSKTRSFCGVDRDGRFGQILVPYDDLNHFGVVVQKQPYHDGIDGLNRDEIENALHELYFVAARSVWYEEQHIDFKDDKDGYVYLIRLQGTELCKIGISKDYPKRIKAFSVEFPIPIEVLAVFMVKGARGLEILMHDQFLDRHKHGEWFEFQDYHIGRFLEMMGDFGRQVK